MTVYTHIYTKLLDNGLTDTQKFTVNIYPYYTRYYYKGQEITRQEYCQKITYYHNHKYHYDYEKKEV